ncbi:hypothetical protein [Pontibacter arcticus]|uniref:Outer membrane protein beta-barrel domain-containing protein n=1 Tax=Pontibacter arcticus TaxID=2080288 RepID=A0A364RG31_9BACT|nr:hypothetical protein [Pontibacter arcticus]RAU83126.1 hypothetical protein DP923_07815 [Pontibacter arcticus]
MKQILLLSLSLLALTFDGIAQDQGSTEITRPQTTAAVASEAVQKGNWIVGASIGSIGFNFKSDLFNLEIMPQAGYFISENAVIGAQVQLGLTAYDGGTNFLYGLTPFARYYFPEGAAPTHRWFGEARVGFAGSSISDSDDDSVFSSVYGVGAGYAHFVASNVALEGVLRLTRSRANIDVGSGDTGLSVGIGLQIYLPGR